MIGWLYTVLERILTNYVGLRVLQNYYLLPSVAKTATIKIEVQKIRGNESMSLKNAEKFLYNSRVVVTKNFHEFVGVSLRTGMGMNWS